MVIFNADFEGPRKRPKHPTNQPNPTFAGSLNYGLEDVPRGRARGTPRTSRGRASAPLGVDARSDLSLESGVPRPGLRLPPPLPVFVRAAAAVV